MALQVCKDIDSIRQWVDKWRSNGETVGFVPTMGNLHAGHLHLVEQAQKRTDSVVVSIFVNPLQFGPGEDFNAYPRTVDKDRQKLEAFGVDLLFLPTNASVFSNGASTTVAVGDLAGRHCGRSRPGHFSGVATIVCKLLNIVQPNQLFLGEKDFQQLLIIRKMISELNFPVQVKAIPTVRESDGLALSSRNSYLNALERQSAPLLYRSLCMAKDQLKNGRRDWAVIEKEQIETLEKAGFTVDFFSICSVEDLLPAANEHASWVILAAVMLGQTRLIDNIRVMRSEF